MIDTIGKLIDAMKNQGVERLYFKKLAPNDNSKNQIYLGGNFIALNIIPHDDVQTDRSKASGSKRERLKANLSFFWIDEEGCHEARNAQLILYPDYPEVRLSGLLLGCRKAPSEIMASRDPGRILFLGITDDRKVIGLAVKSGHPLAKAVTAKSPVEQNGVFCELSLSGNGSRSRDQLLSKLLEIHQKGWINSQKLDQDGIAQPYAASNAGGYTLEAQLGVKPNSEAKPDYLGWEIKQYGVKDFVQNTAKSPVSLMTPEPTGGIYQDMGRTYFMRTFGYPDKSGRNREDRINFGGRYVIGDDYHPLTGLKLEMPGYCSATGKFTNFAEGGIALVTKRSETAAIWGFQSLMSKWEEKHAHAAYVPSKHRKPPPQYCYGDKILLCEGTDFMLFVRAISNGAVYFDPGSKMENASTNRPTFKFRSQFRIKQASIPNLYHSSVSEHIA